MSESLIGQIITAIVTLGVALIGYLRLKTGQEKMEGKVDTYRTEVDGMKSELVEAVKGRGEAEGELKAHANIKASESTAPVPDNASVTDADAKKVADTVVDTVKADPEIEVKKTGKTPPGKK